MFDVLMYLFENYMQDNCHIDLTEEALLSHLNDAGFEALSIENAFRWLEGLLNAPETLLLKTTDRSLRIYTSVEMAKIDSEARAFLLRLEQKKILTTHTRELVIDRIMAIEDLPYEIDLYCVKWITLLVLFNQPNQEPAIACMQELLLDSAGTEAH